MMSNDAFLVTGGLEPLTVTIDQTMTLTGESRSQIYNLIGAGKYEAVKSGTRTLVVYESIKRRLADLPRAQIKPPAPKPRRGPPTSRLDKPPRAAPATKRG